MSVYFFAAFQAGEEVKYRTMEYNLPMGTGKATVGHTKARTVSDTICGSIVKWASSVSGKRTIYILGNKDSVKMLKRMLSGNSLDAKVKCVPWEEETVRECQHGVASHPASTNPSYDDVNFRERCYSILCPHCFKK